MNIFICPAVNALAIVSCSTLIKLTTALRRIHIYLTTRNRRSHMATENGLRGDLKICIFNRTPIPNSFHNCLPFSQVIMTCSVRNM